MLRLILLILSGTIIFTGVIVLFMSNDALIKLIAIMVFFVGCWLMWLVEKRTKKSLEKDSLLNRILNTDA